MIQTIFLGIILILGLIGLFKIGKIEKKSLIFSLLILIITSALFYQLETENDIYQAKVVQINLDFVQGREIQCQDIVVTNKIFNITSNSFIAKQDSKYRGAIIPFKNCFKKEEN